MILATLAALLAAALFALANALQHRSAGLVEHTTSGGGGAPGAGDAAGAGGAPGEDHRTGALRSLVRFLLASARHPFWLLGGAVEVVGLGFHAFALRDGPLTLVQPLLVSSVIFALPIRQLIERRRPRPAEIGAAAVLSVGLAVFLVAATPTAGSTRPPDLIPTLVAAVTVPASLLACLLAGTRVSAERSAAILGIGAGIAFAATAALIKEVMDQLRHQGLGVALGSWPLYALVATGGAGLVLNQLAYRAAPLRASLATLSAADPIASVALGVGIFDEAFRRSLPALSLEVLGMVVAMAALIHLTRHWPQPDEEAPPRSSLATPPLSP